MPSTEPANEHPEVTLNWPGTDSDEQKQPSRRSGEHAAPSSRDSNREGTSNERIASDPETSSSSRPRSGRNLLRLRLPDAARHVQGNETNTGLEVDEDQAHDASTGTELARLNAEVARLRSEVNQLRRRIEDLES